MNRELSTTQHPTTEEALQTRVDELECEVRSLQGRLSSEALIAACKNIGYDLTCPTCASVFFTGFALPHDVHTCALKDRPAEDVFRAIEDPSTMSFEAARAHLQKEVYKATALLERLGSRVIGNGHHMRQKVAEFTATLLSERWTEQK